MEENCNVTTAYNIRKATTWLDVLYYILVIIITKKLKDNQEVKVDSLAKAVLHATWQVRPKEHLK
jgi:hypothetical protein